MDGILLVDKPAGMSSFGVVARVRNTISQITGTKVKVGHAGTLDPFATGLLILMVGKATKQAGEFLKLDKSYEALIILGQESTTADPEGQIKKSSNRVPSSQEIEEAIYKLKGNIKQTPPIYSAIKIGGRRAYDLARNGHDFEMSPRDVTIYDYKDVVYNYPELKFTVEVGSGTYIRSLAVDIGKIVKTGAYLKELRRTSIGKHLLRDAHSLESINVDSIDSQLIPIDKI